MKKLFVVAMLVGFSVCSYGQFAVSPSLMDAVRDNSSEYLTVNVFLENVRSMAALADELDKAHAVFDDRVKAVTRLLHDNHDYAMAKFESQLDRRYVSSMQGYWIANAVNMTVRADYIYKIASFENVTYVDLDAPRYKIVDGSSVVASNTERSVNGVEWGVRAINAPAMWAMNYTGRGVVMLSIDTGVNPEHPAISTNYLGNNYPQSQCWYGMRNEGPRDNASSSHGTHTTGTAMGLDRATNDTIGIAYNAKWIACDPVASTNSELLTVSEFFSVYQWVFNPDGNEQTTNDVPRVINNSWGYDYTLAMGFDACSLPENSIVETLETAGICSPFSAGNEGPGESTVGYPAMLTYNLVNPMSVAAVTSSNVAASFSSRGPSLCTDEESALKIKPEVSAPGVNVRSCVGTDSYSNLQGTSMACPHVSGALLLLAEAFPMASAKELKEALYFTAVDLGDEGEDNTYGRGMIDVMAAFEYLSQIYTPATPVSSSFDAEVKFDLLYDNDNEDGFIGRCVSDAPQVKAVVFNHGNIDNLDVMLNVYYGDEFVLDTTFEAIPADGQVECVLENINAHGGMNEISAYVSTWVNCQEQDDFNNYAAARFYSYFESEFPYSMNFENGRHLTDNQVVAENPNLKKTWKVIPWGENSEHNALGYSFSENTKTRDVDYAYLPQTDLPDADSIFFNFVYAYKLHYLNGYKDSLFVELSTDCGRTFPYTIWSNGYEGLCTEEGETHDYYVPLSIAEFDTVSVPLSDFRGQNVMLRLRVKNGKSSELYVNEISMGERLTNDIQEPAVLGKDAISVYPNPSRGIVDVCVPSECIGLSACVYDICGKLVAEKIVDGQNFTFDLSSYSEGVYIMRLSGTNMQAKVVLLKK